MPYYMRRPRAELFSKKNALVCKVNRTKAKARFSTNAFVVIPWESWVDGVLLKISEMLVPLSAPLSDDMSCAPQRKKDVVQKVTDRVEARCTARVSCLD